MRIYHILPFILSFFCAVVSGETLAQELWNGERGFKIYLIQHKTLEPYCNLENVSNSFTKATEYLKENSFEKYTPFLASIDSVTLEDEIPANATYDLFKRKAISKLQLNSSVYSSDTIWILPPHQRVLDTQIGYTSEAYDTLEIYIGARYCNNPNAFILSILNQFLHPTSLHYSRDISDPFQPFFHSLESRSLPGLTGYQKEQLGWVQNVDLGGKADIKLLRPVEHRGGPLLLNEPDTFIPYSIEFRDSTKMHHQSIGSPAIINIYSGEKLLDSLSVESSDKYYHKKHFGSTEDELVIELLEMRRNMPIVRVSPRCTSEIAIKSIEDSPYGTGTAEQYRRYRIAIPGINEKCLAPTTLKLSASTGINGLYANVYPSQLTLEQGQSVEVLVRAHASQEIAPGTYRFEISAVDIDKIPPERSLNPFKGNRIFDFWLK